jgi:signal transduction histidine kinase
VHKAKAFDRKIIGGFILALVLLLTIGVCFYRSTTSQAETARRVAHTYEVLVRIQELVMRLTDAETARRGFIMTTRDRYLFHYTNAVERARVVFNELRETTRDNLRNQQTCDALAPLIQQRFALHGESIETQLKQGADPAAQLKLTEKGQEVMEGVRALINQMDAAEHELLRTRQAAAEVNLRNTRLIALIGSFASLAILVSVFSLLMRENRQRREAEQALKTTNEQLELRVRERTAELTRTLAGYEQAEREIKKLNEELEQRVTERTAQLENANQELEAFSYSVSHDLRAPLRHIHGFVEMLRDDTASTFSEQSRRYLEVISESANQMGRLIDDLLLFSRMNREEMRRVRINTDELIKEVVHELTREIREREITWEIDPLPVVFGDRSMLKQVWANLLSNAVKYTHGREQTRIKIRCYKTPSHEWQFSVQDNGAGFDMQYVDKLFGVFQRLHRPEEFEGTGIGLANVRRIVHRHGGRTWAEGQVNEGATFYFTLPDPT